MIIDNTRNLKKKNDHGCVSCVSREFGWNGRTYHIFFTGSL